MRVTDANDAAHLSPPLGSGTAGAMVYVGLFLIVTFPMTGHGGSRHGM
jgi:hypothetical protein